MKFGPYIALVIMTGLYLGKRDDLATEIERCNTDKMTSIAEAEHLVRVSVAKSFQDRLDRAEERASDLARERRTADHARDAAVEGSNSAQSTIDRLMAEARNELLEVPDGKACSNAIMPSDAIDSLR